jgi:predicted ATPase/DNA-binding SARP family transcriptional activator
MPPSTGVWHIELFGPLCARRESRIITHFKTPKTSALLAYLASGEQQAYRREELVDIFWPEDPFDAGRLSLRVALHTLRSYLDGPQEKEDSVLVSNRASVHLDPTAYTTDKAEFEDYLKRALRASAEADQKAWLIRAIELYHGELLPGLEDPWIVGTRQRLADSYLMALRRLIKLLGKNHEYDLAIEYARRAIQTDPLREESHRTLMRLYALIGRPKVALQQYHELQRILKSELDITPSAHTRELAQQFSQSSTSSQAEESQAVVDIAPMPSQPTVETSVAPSNLPAPTTPFLGREDSIETVVAMLDPSETRLVTLTGLAGCGKSRLALAVAMQLQDVYQGAVWWVPLASLSDPSLIGEAIGQALRLPPSAEGTRFDQVVEALATRPTLLILDNFEHLADGGAATVQTLLERVPHLTCLITSRHRLKLTSEYEYLVRPLEIPAFGGSVESLVACASVQLFVDRARAVNPSFRLTEINRTPIATICQQLEGIPLALELAAAWVQTLTPAQILARLTPRFKLLVSRNADVPIRHASLRVALDWSVDQLYPDDRRFFTYLAVFRGGWTLEAAEAVCTEPNSLEYLTQLRERSLLIAEENADGMRFRLLETLREYADWQLGDKTRAEIANRHAAYYLELAEQAFKEIYGPDAALWLDRLEAERDNLYAALDWTLRHPETATGLQLAGALSRFWYVRGYAEEGLRWLERALRVCPDAPALLRAHALAGAGHLAYSQGNFEEARLYFEQALTLRREMDDDLGVASVLGGLGLVANDLGDYPTAQGLFEEALALFRERNDPHGISITLANLARVANDRGDYATARTLHAESLALFRAAGDRQNILTALNNLAHAILRTEDYETARPLLEESLMLSNEMEYGRSLAQCLTGFASLAFLQGRIERTVILLASAEALRDRTQVRLTERVQAELEQTCVAVRETLGETIFSTLWEQGRATDMEQIQLLAVPKAKNPVEMKNTVYGLGSYSQAHLFYEQPLVLRGYSINRSTSHTSAVPRDRIDEYHALRASTYIGETVQPSSKSKYPLGLLEEYRTLALKQLLKPLSSEEETRLQKLMDQISEIDRADPASNAMRARLDALDAELEQIHAKAQALLDAQKQS